MYYNVLKADEIVNTSEKKFERKVLLEDGETKLTIIALNENEIIDTHTSKSNAAVYLLDGEIELHFDAEKFLLQKGDILMFKKDDEHKVVALKNSKFLLFKL